MAKLIVKKRVETDGKFLMEVFTHGIRVTDQRHSPAKKCGTLRWKEIMEIIQSHYENGEPCINPSGLR